MSNRIDLAKQLLKDQEFDIAKHMLEKETNDPEALYLLSLLYRYDDEYDKEKAVVAQALEIDGSNAYMRERLAWNNLPIFDRVVPRQPLHLPRDPKTIPSAEVLENLCFVTTGGSDEPFRQLLIELLESLEATQLYKNVPVYIFDAGFTDDDKNFLYGRFKNIKQIKDPGWDIDPRKGFGLHNKGNMNGYKAMTARPFIPKHFPGHRYYMWIDTDCWVQDERAIDTMVHLAVTQGVSICPDLIPQIRGLYHGHMMPEKYQVEEILSRHTLMNSVVCIDTKGDFFNLWQKYFLELYDLGKFNHFADQLSINLAMAQEGKNCVIPPLQETQLIVSSNYGCPVLSEDKKTILNIQKNVVGFLHLTWYTKNPDYTPYRRPFLKSESKDLSKDHVHRIEGAFHRKLPVFDQDVVYASLCYRIWPWADKKTIKDLLLMGKKSEGGNV